MKGLTEIQSIIEDRISAFNYPDSPDLLYNPIEYIMSLPGKRIRPLLVLMAYQLFDKNLKKALSPAIGIELFHNFTLLHDDIMDNAPLRRGSLTVHEKWNSNIAILSGDVMMIQAYQLIAEVDSYYLKVVIELFSKSAVQVCEGQQWDMNFETQTNITLVDYIKMIEYKTAVLLAVSMQIGSIIAGANKEEQNHLYNFGINMGIAFQLKDDLLDVFGKQDTFGKQLGGDIFANKKTFLYLKAFQLGDDLIKEKLEILYNNNDTSFAKVKEVTDIFKTLDIQKHTVDMMKSYYIKGMKHLDDIDSDAKEPLISFASTLMNRVS